MPDPVITDIRLALIEAPLREPIVAPFGTLTVRRTLLVLSRWRLRRHRRGVGELGQDLVALLFAEADLEQSVAHSGESARMREPGRLRHPRGRYAVNPP